ncbi:hypothetical protein Q3O59_13780 [Alkalimonas delamerensis]|uniref:Outer membrane protein beta-barrel domain-containing protein n=1 Tax=Alkalimonas delamerensis TaxID=265981 RepID=A0ABT9GSZ9_9GAMM|nr:hypothetical protein [Alkalimonas delamerensis]MDP4530093.1 hypothetical protein [Alkalimonas delamerensis]
MRVTLLLSAVVTAFSLSAAAGDWPGHRFVEASFVSFEDKFDGQRNDFSGYDLKGSFLINQHLFVAGEYSRVEDTVRFSDGYDNYRIYNRAIGLGVITPVAPNTVLDLAGYFGSFRLDEKIVDGNVTILEKDKYDYLKVEGTLRSMITPDVELYGRLGYVYLDEPGIVDKNQFTQAIGLHYFLSRNLSFLAEFERGDFLGGTYTQGRLGARFSF